jgi:hypothetical protein
MKFNKFAVKFTPKGRSKLTQISLGVGFTIALLPLLSQNAIAAGFDGIHRSTFGGKDKIFIPNQTPNTTVSLTVETSELKPVNFTNANCGIVRLADSPTKPITAIDTGGSLTFNFAGKITDTVPPPGYSTGVCQTFPSPGYRTQGTVVKVGNALYLYANAPLGAINLRVSYGKTSNVKINACGFGAIAITPTRPLTNFIFAGTAYTLTNLPTTTNGALICRKDAAGNGISFVPLAGF